MKGVILIISMMLSCICGLAQDFHMTDNVSMEEISELEFRNAYKNRKKDIYKWKNRGGNLKWIENLYFSDSKLDRWNRTNYKSSNPLGKWDLYYIKLKNGNKRKSYILKERAPTLSHAYYIGESGIDQTEMFGEGNVDNRNIYYAEPDFDCDFCVHCRWYSFTDGKPSLLAEIKDTTDFISAIYDLPVFFRR